MSPSFKKRLDPLLPDIVNHFGTPFHIYDESGIRDTGQKLLTAFSRARGFKEYFAVKALPNPRILQIMADMGFGFDCSSVPELHLCRKIGARGEDIMFTANNTRPEEFTAALDKGGCILNLDDISLISKLPRVPELISFRYNPGPARTGNSIIGNPVEAKYGVSHDQLPEAFSRAKRLGARCFGLHAMLASNELNFTYMVQTVAMLLGVAESIGDRLGTRFEFINMGGGFGIPYRPSEAPLALEAMADQIIDHLTDYQRRCGYSPRLFTECGRFISGPHGVLVTTAINRKDIYRTYIGVDACMSALMRPGVYGAYHHLTVLGKMPGPNDPLVDVVGSLCENNDKFAIQRKLPPIDEGDILCIHDTGAHGHAMGFNYNGRLRPKELLLTCDGSVELIRRGETMADYLATLTFVPQTHIPPLAMGKLNGTDPANVLADCRCLLNEPKKNRSHFKKKCHGLNFALE
jgi:diaminopimelate decarboxylase